MKRDETVVVSDDHGSPKSFNATVHGARGLFALFIFIFHVTNSGYRTWPLLRLPAVDYLLRSTEFGVELFFCISGYVICGALRRARGPERFLQDRAIRIYPALGASVLAVVAIGLVKGGTVFGFDIRHITAVHVVLSLLALPGILPVGNLNPVGWSLGYEMCFYIFCAASWWALRGVGRGALLALLPLGAVLVALYPRAMFLLSGVLVAEGVVGARPLGRLARYPIPWLIAFLLLWHTVQILSLPREFTGTTLFGWMQDRRLPLALLAFGAATLGFAGIAAGHGPLAAVLRGRAFQYLGTISYSFYLWHIIVLAGVIALLRHAGVLDGAGDAAQALIVLFGLPPSLLLAHLSQRTLEARAGVWLRRRLHRNPAHPAASVKVVPAVMPLGGRR